MKNNKFTKIIMMYALASLMLVSASLNYCAAPQINFDHLPDEIIIYILTGLPQLSDFGHVAQVSKRYQTLSQDLFS